MAEAEEVMTMEDDDPFFFPWYFSKEEAEDHAEKPIDDETWKKIKESFTEKALYYTIL